MVPPPGDATLGGADDGLGDGRKRKRRQGWFEATLADSAGEGIKGGGFELGA